jgi:hypothetical protein
MGVASALLALCCALAALPVNLGAQQQLVVDAGRLQDALRALNVSAPATPEAQAAGASIVFPADTEPAEMLLKCKTTCAFDGPNTTHTSAASTCARCLDRTASDIIDRVIATQEQLTSFRIQTRADRALYSRKEEARLIAAHESAVLQLRNAIQPAMPLKTRRNGTNVTVGPSLLSSSAVGLDGPSVAQATLFKTGESAKMKQTSGKVLGGASVAVASTSAVDSAAVSASAVEAMAFPSDASSSSSSSSSLSSPSASSTVPYVFFSPRQECYRVCGDNSDVSHDDDSASFVELGSQMLSQEFSSMGTMEQCIRL